MRVDKMIGNTGLDTRKNIKRNAKKGALVINGEIVKDSSVKVDPFVDEVFYMGHFVEYIENIYLILNKPAGVLSATQDRDKTVIDLLDDFYLNYDISIAGRLDKDTTGLILLSTDGKFIHKITSPNSNITKTYEVTDAFSGIAVKDIESCVRLVPSADGRCRVSCPEEEDGSVDNHDGE